MSTQLPMCRLRNVLGGVFLGSISLIVAVILLPERELSKLRYYTWLSFRVTSVTRGRAKPRNRGKRCSERNKRDGGSTGYGLAATCTRSTEMAIGKRRNEAMKNGVI